MGKHNCSSLRALAIKTYPFFYALFMGVLLNYSRPFPAYDEEDDGMHGGDGKEDNATSLFQGGETLCPVYGSVMSRYFILMCR